MYNTQKMEAPDYRDDRSIEVHSIWDTIQGEGPFAGMPATFVRLTGCNLQCRLCDTNYTSKRELTTPGKLLEQIEELPRRRVVVFTGGEPFRQRLDLAIDRITDSGRLVQIETNGTLCPQWLKDWNFGLTGEYEDIVIVCSPKTQAINNDMWQYIDALKYVVRAKYIDEDGLPKSSVGPQYGAPARPPNYWRGEIYVQPLDMGIWNPVQNEENMKAAADVCMRHGYRLSIQMHKLVGLE